ncbi:MAG: virulence RhuM family protein [Clostridiales bacterium]|jgi:hypothetical protein|nr:virulence RhuM family protein [Clostridiales bacterium]
MKSNDTDIIIYQSGDGKVKIDVHMKGETLWLSQIQIAELFGRDKSVINRHINNILREGELDEKVVVAIFAIATQHGAMEGKTQEHNVMHYSLDMVLAVGYRVKSPRGTQFRQWATQILHEYLQKGFAMNDEVLKNMGGGVYWKELLERIRDIRASEKVMYRQILDLYATSLDYNATMPETLDKFSRDFGVGVLNSAGSVRHTAAVEKAYNEYDKYRAQLADELSDVEKAYLDTLNAMQKRLMVGGGGMKGL